MANWKLQSLRGKQRRDFLKLMLTVGAGLGLERSGVLNYIADIAGHKVAEAAVSSTNRALLVSCGMGSFAWMQELWPMPEIALKIDQFPTAAWLYHNNGQVGYTGDPGYYVDATAASAYGGRHFYYGPDAPWLQDDNMAPSATNLPTRQVTGIMAGSDETHTPFPETATMVGTGADLPAVVGALQANDSTSVIVPAIGIDPLEFGQADGAPIVVSVPSAQGLIDTFNSAASRVFEIQEANYPEALKGTNRGIFETYYNSMVGLRRAAPRSSWQPELVISKNAAHLVGLNLSNGLLPTPQDLIDFGLEDMLAESTSSGTGLDMRQRVALEAFGRTLIVIARAFASQLTNMAVVGLSPSSNNDNMFTDPHKTFASAGNMQQGRNTTKYLGKILNGFYDYLDTVPEPDADGEKMSDNTVFATWGDTPHTPLKGDGWPDATPVSCNWLYAMDPKQNIVSGWFGQVHATTDNSSARRVSGFDPVTGVEVVNRDASGAANAGYMDSQQTAPAAGAAVGYAVTKGDWNAVAAHYAGPKPEAMLKT